MLCVIGLKEFLVGNTTTFGLLDKHLRRAAYDLSQDWIGITRSSEVPVAVIDIGGPCPTKENPNPRRSLEDALTAVLQRDPAAVAIDVDFSPGVDLSCKHAEVPAAAPKVPLDCSAPNPEAEEWTDRGGPPFFQFCLATKRKIFLGVYRQQYRSRDQWLGAAMYAPLAASLLIPAAGLEPEPESEQREQARLYMGRYVQGCDRLDSVSQRLATAYGRDERPLLRRLLSTATPGWMKKRLFGEFIESDQVRTTSATMASIFLVDFSALKPLQEHRRKWANGELSGDDSLQGKLVLLGYTDLSNPETDRFIAPGEQEQAAGVFWHACGTDTLIHGALLQPTALGSLVLDLVTYLPIIVLITWLNLHVSEEYREAVAERVESIATKVLAVLIFLCGTYFVGRLRIIWADFLIVALIVLIHPPLERSLTLCGEWLWKKMTEVPGSHKEG